MGYADLIRQAWRTGRFLARPRKAGAARPAAAQGRGSIRSEMEEIVKREAADALGCLAPQGEATMKLAPFVKFREEKFGAVLFETRSEKVFTLNPTAAAVVREVLAGASEGDLGERLSARYSDPGGKLKGDAVALVRQLKSKGLLTD